MGMGSSQDYQLSLARVKEEIAKKSQDPATQEVCLVSINYDETSNSTNTLKGVTKFIKHCLQRYVQRSIDTLGHDIQSIEGALQQSRLHLESSIGSDMGKLGLRCILLLYILCLGTCVTAFTFLAWVMWINSRYVLSFASLGVMALLLFGVSFFLVQT